MERVYKTMRGSGSWSIALGVVVMSVGVVCGIMMIISGAKLLADKSKLIF